MTASLFEFGALAEHFAVGVLLLDGTLALQFANRKGCEAWGYSESAALTRDWESITKRLALAEQFSGLPKNAAPLQEKLRLRLATKNRHVRVEVYPLQHDGCDCYLVLSKDPGANDPVDEIWMLASQVQALSTLASTIAHDLGSAVNNMQLSLRLFEAAIKAPSRDPERTQAAIVRYARVLREEFDQIADLARALPQLIKAPQASASASTDVRELLVNVERWVKHHAAAKQVRRELRLPKVPALAVVNAQKLEFALFNLVLALVDNAPSGDVLSLILSLERKVFTVTLRTQQSRFLRELIAVSEGVLPAPVNGALPIFAARLVVEAQGGELDFSDGGVSITLPRVFS